MLENSELPFIFPPDSDALLITETLIKRHVVALGKSGNRKNTSDGKDNQADNNTKNGSQNNSKHATGNDTNSTPTTTLRIFNNTLKPNQLNNYTRYLRSKIQNKAVPILKQFIGPPNEIEANLNSLYSQQKIATSYKEWLNCSSNIDLLLSNNDWKAVPESNLYDHALLQFKLNELRQLRSAKNYSKLLYIIRTTWFRNVANINNINLYRHSLVGTKYLIQDYLEECQVALNSFANPEIKTGIDDRYILSILIQTRKAIGRTALVLSGGGCFGMFHIGVLSTLLEINLLPKIISGSSAGSIVAAILCAHSNEEINVLMDDILSKKFNIFSSDINELSNDPNHISNQVPKDTSLGHKLSSAFFNLVHFFKTGNWCESRHLQKTMFEFLGNLTFRESYNRTGRILNITVSSASSYEQPNLLNYLTAPNVLVWSAVCASCALPGFFPSTTLYEKNLKSGKIQEWNHPSVKFIDGSVDNDIPLQKLSELFNVNHIIVSQVNPHIVPFLKLSLKCVGGEIENEFSAKLKNISNSIFQFINLEFIHFLNTLDYLNISTDITKKIKSAFSQQYSGDITILPGIRILELDKMLTDPSPEFLLDCIVRGARATWPKIDLIHNHCCIEFLLDSTISKLRSRIISKRQHIQSSYLLISKRDGLYLNDMKRYGWNICSTGDENSAKGFENIDTSPDGSNSSEIININYSCRPRSESSPLESFFREKKHTLIERKTSIKRLHSTDHKHAKVKYGKIRSNSSKSLKRTSLTEYNGNRPGNRLSSSFSSLTHSFNDSCFEKLLNSNVDGSWDTNTPISNNIGTNSLSSLNIENQLYFKNEFGVDNDDDDDDDDDNDNDNNEKDGSVEGVRVNQSNAQASSGSMVRQLSAKSMDLNEKVYKKLKKSKETNNSSEYIMFSASTNGKKNVEWIEESQNIEGGRVTKSFWKKLNSNDTFEIDFSSENESEANELVSELIGTPGIDLSQIQ
ncbi:patatin-domain-containing protein [Ascoidea rubescens DSM 1968]|uniref:Patatin-domain-containing protein n=1 Tax=Ascoidea rubescens DSM 1968 TaxID=1344418 RepID=A0A1D2VFH0_9ASCO|nr:patatin-domain-containing protein [Ascoidea rubescens DSM 1968]ODV60375.1 patatin-domain-containing protein [Ascoidea rubescens DSM 1968]